MIKLKKIVTHLDDGIYKQIEETLQKNKAENFLYLLRSYRNTELRDQDIAKELSINPNSLYVLKSRLNDKIQEHLSGDIFTDKEEVLKQLHQIPEICYGSSREIATTFLQKLETDLLMYDMHNELLVVYSALKKIHMYSEKYFHYSQSYNRHTAFNISLEKCEEILGNFNRVLGQYNFARSPRQLETLVFLNKEVNDHFALNPSRQLEVIKNFIELELAIFTYGSTANTHNTEEVLQHTHKMLVDLPSSSLHKNWINALDYLFFEYYRKTGQLKMAMTYYEKVNNNIDTLLLYTHIALTSKFLISKLNFLQEGGRTSELEQDKNILYDVEDKHTGVLMGIYKAMCAYHKGSYKEAASKLNEIINTNSFKDFFHINTEVKLTLAFVYIQMKEFDLADNLVKNIYRKIKSEELTGYSNVLDLIKVFNADIKNNGKVTEKQRDDFVLFLARNNKESEILSHLVNELKKKYS
jgi:tetratricopeptide (TPR) repeat protein